MWFSNRRAKWRREEKLHQRRSHGNAADASNGGLAGDYATLISGDAGYALPLAAAADSRRFSKYVNTCV